MKYYLMLLTFAFSFPLFSQQWTDKTRILPDELRKIPVAIYIVHSPNPNYPEITINTDNTDSKYVWKHSTSIVSPDIDLTVIKAGSYIWYSEAGWMQNVQYNKRDFTKKFHCPKGKLLKGQRYTFEKNYRYGNQLYGGDALWYILAEDEDGNVYKGMAIIETESEILNP